MQRSDLFPGKRVEDAYGRDYFVISTATWRPTWFRSSYTFMGENYSVEGEIAPRGRYVLVKNVKANVVFLRKPKEFNECGTYKAAEFDSYVWTSNKNIERIEQKDVSFGKLWAFWGDATPEIIRLFDVNGDEYYHRKNRATAIEYGRVHYASTRP